MWKYKIFSKGWKPEIAHLSLKFKYPDKLQSSALTRFIFSLYSALSELHPVLYFVHRSSLYSGLCFYTSEICSFIKQEQTIRNKLFSSDYLGFKQSFKILQIGWYSSPMFYLPNFFDWSHMYSKGLISTPYWITCQV